MSHESYPTGESRLAGGASGQAPPAAELPFFSRVPDTSVIWSRMLFVVWLLVAWDCLKDISQLLMYYWYLESFELKNMFWTNFWTGATLFVVGFVVFTAVIAVPALLHNIPRMARSATIHLALIVGVFGGYYFQGYYLDFLMLQHGGAFGKTDPIFENDIGYYVFSLPAYWIIWGTAVYAIVFGLLSSLRCAFLDQNESKYAPGANWLVTLVRRFGTPSTQVYVVLLGILLAAGQFLSRYEVLYWDNERLRIMGGPQYIDVTGLFSTLNAYWLSIITILGVTGAIVYFIRVLHREGVQLTPTLRRAGAVAVLFLAADLCFNLGLWVRQTVFVTPQEPVIQLPYIKNHIDYTMDAYDLNDVEVVNFKPHDSGDPIPDAEELLQSVAVKNAPLWPGYVAYLESFIDPQHAERILKTGGETMIYGPTKELFKQQQKLRMYYDFINVDAQRYTVDGEKRLYVTAVRELPKYAPEPWLYHWGQRQMFYTHGYGLVAAPASQVSGEGDPIYASYGIPPQTNVPAFEVEDQSVYFGEAATSAFLSNLKNFASFDHPGEDGIVVSEFPQESTSGVKMDSFLKRLVMGWRLTEMDRAIYPDAFWEYLMSDMITDETKVHFLRRPIDRVETIAPFLYYDTNIWASAVDGKIVWMINAMTSTEMYPLSRRRVLGDKATIRTKYPRPQIMANYIRDSVKCTVDARTGEVALYKLKDDPIINTWDSIYPGLFADISEMPAPVRDQMQYPLQLFHRQFDDVYKAYHMSDPLEFFNMEDLWDDCDEVLGPIMDKGESITFSFEPYHWIAQTGDGVFPESKESTQFVMSMPFTNEKAMNLRAIPTVYQDGEDYGKLMCLSLAKGTFRMSPEQADAAIDQEPTISEQISWWNRLGNEVIHGHTSLLIANGELVYVVPMFIRSEQERYTQLKRVCVVFRGVARMGNTLEEALQLAVEAARSSSGEQATPTLTEVTHDAG